MAVRTPEEPAPVATDAGGIGPGGRRLADLLAESERLLAETGRYCAIERLDLRESDPMGYEKLFSRLRGGLVSARETAMNVSASPIVKELGELCFALYTPEGDSVALSTGIILHVHTMSEAIKFMVRGGWEDNPGIRPGDIFVNNEPRIGGNHNADVMTLVPIFHGDTLVGWAGGVTHVMDIGATIPGSVPIGATTLHEDGLDFHCMKVGENDTLASWHLVRCRMKSRVPGSYVLDERTRLVGCHMVRDAIDRVIAEVGVERYLQFVREIIEDGRRVFVAHVRDLLVPGRYRSAGFFDAPFAEKPEVPLRGRRDTILHGPWESRIGVDAHLEIDLAGASAWGWHALNASRSMPEGALWVLLTQTIICNDKINDGAYYGMTVNLPEGTWLNIGDNPAATGAGWAPTAVTAMGYARSVARALQARGYIEEVVGAFAFTGNLTQGGGRDQYGQLSGYLNFEPAAQGGGAKYVLDGLDYGAAWFNPEGDMGDPEMWEMVAPLLYLSRRVKPDTCGYGRHRGGAGFESLSMVWGSDEYELQNCLSGRMFSSPGLFGGYPAPTGYIHNLSGADLIERAQRGEAYPLGDGGEDEPGLLALEGERDRRHENVGMPKPVRTGDLYLSVIKGAGGLGDPLLRPVEAVRSDVADGFLSPRFAEDVYAVTDREAARAARRERSGPVADWWAAQRARILAHEVIAPVQVMYAESMKLGPAWAAEFRGFWDLPEAFEFDVPTPTLFGVAAQPGKVTPDESASAYLASARERRGAPPDDVPVPVTTSVTETTLAALLDERLSRAQVKTIQSAYKEPGRFDVWLRVLQARVSYEEPIVLPLGEGLNVVRRRADGELVVRCDCGHDFCGPTRNWKMSARIIVRDDEASLREIYRELGHADPDWMELREFVCPGCSRLLETEAVTPGYPVIHEFLPDIDGFYRDWLGREVPA